MKRLLISLAFLALLATPTVASDLQQTSISGNSAYTVNTHGAEQGAFSWHSGLESVTNQTELVQGQTCCKVCRKGKACGDPVLPDGRTATRDLAVPVMATKAEENGL